MTEEKSISHYPNGNIEWERKGTPNFYSMRYKGQGEIIKYREDGKKEEERKGTFNDGKLTEGEIIYYNPYGNIEWERKGTFNDGWLNGQSEKNSL